MRIAISGTHGVGKSTLIDDFAHRHPDYIKITEAYYQLHDEELDFEYGPSLESFKTQLDFSINQLLENVNRSNIIYDRCSIDFLAYSMYALNQDNIDIADSDLSSRFDDIKSALASLDLIVFIPLMPGYQIDYAGEDPDYREGVDQCFKAIYRDEVIDIFPGYHHPQVIEVWGDPKTRIAKLESYLA